MGAREPVQDLSRENTHSGEILAQAIGRIQRYFQSASIAFFQSAKGAALTAIRIRNCFALPSVLRELPRSSQRFQGRTSSASLRSSSRLSSGYSSADEKDTVATCRGPLVAASSI